MYNFGRDPGLQSQVNPTSRESTLTTDQDFFRRHTSSSCAPVLRTNSLRDEPADRSHT